MYLVLDALDECITRSILLKGLEEMHHWDLPNLHILVTSRKETDIEDSLGCLVTSQITLEENVVDFDTRTFVQDQIQRDPKLLKWPQHTRGEIEKVLLNGANGMYDSIKAIQFL